MATMNFPDVPLKKMDAGMLSFELLRSIQVFDKEGQAMILSAAQLATFLHQGQTRKSRDGFDRVPYIEHPVRMAIRVIRWGVTDPAVVVAALLHDTVEDCLKRYVENFVEPVEGQNDMVTVLEWLAESYTPRAALIIRFMTVDKNKPYITKFNGIAAAASEDDEYEALVIYASDLVDNAGSLPHQFGSVPDQMIDKLLAKYLPIIPKVVAALEAFRKARPTRYTVGQFNSAGGAIDHLNEILAKCEALQEFRAKTKE